MSTDVIYSTENVANSIITLYGNNGYDFKNTGQHVFINTWGDLTSMCLIR